MKLSRTAGYAIHAMVYIAQHDGNGQPVIGHQAAKATRIPEGFLLRILVALARAGLLRSMKGPNGGYNLGMPAAKITFLDIIEAVEGPMRGVAEPVSHPADSLDQRLQAVATTASDSMRKELTKMKLVDLMAEKKKR